MCVTLLPATQSLDSNAQHPGDQPDERTTHLKLL